MGKVNISFLDYKDAEPVFKLRHQLFCGEGKEPLSPYKLETDDFDRSSHHILITVDDIPKGCCRVCYGALPCRGSIEVFPEYESILKDRSVVEISRVGSVGSRLLPTLATAILIDIRLSGVNKFVAVTDIKVYRALTSFGILFTRIGPDQQYRGVRAPYLGDVNNIMKNLEKVNPTMYNNIIKGMEDEFKNS